MDWINTYAVPTKVVEVMLPGKSFGGLRESGEDVGNLIPANEERDLCLCLCQKST